MVLDGRAAADASLMPAAHPRAYLLAFYPEAQVAPIDRVDALATPLVARVNHGTWIAPCPCAAPGLPRPGMIVFKDTPIAWCLRCENAEVGGAWRPVVLPPPDEVAAIEALLSARPDLATRNWEPGETVADLAAENAAHGLVEGV